MKYTGQSGFLETMSNLSKLNPFTVFLKWTVPTTVLIDTLRGYLDYYGGDKVIYYERIKEAINKKHWLFEEAEFLKKAILADNMLSGTERNEIFSLIDSRITTDLSLAQTPEKGFEIVGPKYSIPSPSPFYDLAKQIDITGDVYEKIRKPLQLGIAIAVTILGYKVLDTVGALRKIKKVIKNV